MNEKPVLTPAELSREWGLGKNTTYDLVNRADFPKIRIGRKILIPREALARWMERQTEQAMGAN